MSVDIPDNFFAGKDVTGVTAWLIRQVAPGKDKARALRHWARWTGAKVYRLDYESVERSGTEAAPQIKLPGERG